MGENRFVRTRARGFDILRAVEKTRPILYGVSSLAVTFEVGGRGNGPFVIDYSEDIDVK